MAITRTHQAGGVSSLVLLSDCEKYRFLLTRIWDDKLPALNFVMLNPSIATETVNDPTAKRCEARARQLGFGSFIITNLFAIRATDPKELNDDGVDIIDDGIVSNYAALRQVARTATMVICGWGNFIPKRLSHHPARILSILQEEKPGKVYHLGRTKSGNPKHPLYISYDTAPVLWGDDNAN